VVGLQGKGPEGCPFSNLGRHLTRRKDRLKSSFFHIFVLQCRTRERPEGQRCLVHVEYSSGCLEDGRRVRSYCVRIWPLTHQEISRLRRRAEISPVVVVRGVGSEAV
jgi:hypothetical protein